MREAPLNHEKKRLIGWYAFCDGHYLVDYVITSAEAAKNICERKSGHPLKWEEKKNISGDSYYNGQDTEKHISFESSVGPLYEDAPEKIAEAEFISEDIRCGYYVIPSADGWNIHVQIDPMSRNRIEIWQRYGKNHIYLESYQQSIKIWDFFLCKETSKEAAIRTAYYLWARDLIEQFRPHKNSIWGKLKHEIISSLI